MPQLILTHGYTWARMFHSKLVIIKYIFRLLTVPEQSMTKMPRCFVPRTAQFLRASEPCRHCRLSWRVKVDHQNHGLHASTPVQGRTHTWKLLNPPTISTSAQPTAKSSTLKNIQCNRKTVFFSCVVLENVLQDQMMISSTCASLASVCAVLRSPSCRASSNLCSASVVTARAWDLKPWMQYNIWLH